MSSSVSLAVLLTSHNRVNKTMACLAAVNGQQGVEDVSMTIYLADAASTDGTPDRVSAEFPDVRLLRVGGDVFWNRGMKHAFSTAVEHGYDFYLWLNDDTILDDNAVIRMLTTHARMRASGHKRTILVGCTRDPESGELTYGGVRRGSRWNGMKFQSVPVGIGPTLVDTMNGNCVLMEAEVVKRVGVLDSAFSHSMGDFDYGLRASKNGCQVWTLPGTVGLCERNTIVGTWMDAQQPIRIRWRRIMSPKGLPPREWGVLSRRHGGKAWPIIWAVPYFKVVVVPVLRTLKNR